MRASVSVPVALLAVATWSATSVFSVRTSSPRRDPTFVTSRDELNFARDDPGHLTLRALDGFDRNRVVVERDGASIPFAWQGDELVADLAGSAPGAHVVTAGIRHRGGVTRMVSVPVATGTPSRFDRVYRRGIRVNLPANLFDDGNLRTRTDLAGALAASLRQEFGRSNNEARLGELRRVVLTFDLGGPDEFLSANGSACFDRGCVAFRVDLRLRMHGERELRLEAVGVYGSVDDALRSWASGQGAAAGGVVGTLLSSNPLTFFLGAWIGASLAEQHAEEEAQRQLNAVIESALARINHGLILSQTFGIPGLPSDTRVRLGYADAPVVSSERGVEIDLDVSIEDSRGVVTLATPDPRADSDAAPRHRDRATVQFSRSLLGAALVAVGTTENVNREVARAIGSRDATALPIRFSSVRAMRDAMPWGGRSSGLSWSIPDVELGLESGLQAHAFLGGRVELEVGPGGETLRARAIPEFVSVGCSRQLADGTEHFPCLDILGTAVPDLPRRLERSIPPMDLFGEALASVRSLPIDADGGISISAILNSVSTGTGDAEYALVLEFDARVR